tara:strand:+ start:105 stop:479 length:375 start_codon:yes stop_codon:yes gene_type:complete
MGTFANSKLVMLYFQTGDGVNDGANEGYAAPLSSFRGFSFIADTDAVEMEFDSMLGTGADIAAVDKVVLNITAAKQKQVIRDITQAINGMKFGDGFITVADDENSVYLSSNITSCGAITVTAAA